MEEHGLLFSGQGSQRLGMGAAFCAASSQARELYAAAEDALGSQVYQLATQPASPDAATPAAFENLSVALPLVYVHGYVAQAVYRERNPQAPIVAAAGLSLGEWTAMAAAGAIGYQECLKLVAYRARLIEQATQAEQGSLMLALGGREEARNFAKNFGLEEALVYAPMMRALGGPRIAVQAALKSTDLMGLFAVQSMPQPGAFHTLMMRSVAEGMRAAVAEVEVCAPAYPIYVNALGAPTRNVEVLRDAMTHNAVRPVYWESCLKAMMSSGLGRLVECGSTMLKKISKNASWRDTMVCVTS